MASKEARRVVCYCLEHPEALKDKETARLYEKAKEELDDKKIKRSELNWYEQKELYFKSRPELEQRIKELIQEDKSNVSVSKLLGIDVKAVAYVKRKHKLFRKKDITKDQLEQMYNEHGFRYVCENLGISETSLTYWLRKFDIKVKNPVRRYKIKAVFENGDVIIFDTSSETAKYFGLTKSGLTYRLNTDKYFDGVKIDRLY